MIVQGSCLDPLEASRGIRCLLKLRTEYILEMGLLNFKAIRRFVLFVWVLLGSIAGLAVGNVVLIGKNVSLSFDDIEAKFTPAIKGSGECGVLHVAEPLDACTPLRNKIDEGSDSAFALIIRGGCTFNDKVRSAQKAGFKAAIMYNNEEHGPLVARTPAGIYIHAVFVSKSSGETLKKYAGRTDIELWIIPTFENSAWSIMVISFMSLLAMSAVLATCFFVRRHHIRREQPRPPNIREFHGMSRRLVKAMPSLIFTSVLEDNCTSATCAICLEDYKVGEKLRILPCRHKFHAMCVDSWLTTRRTFCPVCKQDARTSTGHPPPSECTPLLSSAASTPASSFYSSVAASSAIQIPPAVQFNQTPPLSPFTNRTLSLASSIPRVPSSRRSTNHAPAMSISRSSTDLRNASYHRSHAFSSSGFPQSSPIVSRFMLSYVPSPNSASASYLAGSSNRHSYLRHHAESGASLSGMDSAHSLPEC